MRLVYLTAIQNQVFNLTFTDLKFCGKCSKYVLMSSIKCSSFGFFLFSEPLLWEMQQNSVIGMKRILFLV